jgi:hypothetical protein
LDGDAGAGAYRWHAAETGDEGEDDETGKNPNLMAFDLEAPGVIGHGISSLRR